VGFTLVRLCCNPTNSLDDGLGKRRIAPTHKPQLWPTTTAPRFVPLQRNAVNASWSAVPASVMCHQVLFPNPFPTQQTEDLATLAIGVYAAKRQVARAIQPDGRYGFSNCALVRAADS